MELMIQFFYMYFKLQDYEEFQRFVGMTVQQFSHLHTMVEPLLLKSSRRKSLPPELRLAITLNS